MKRQFIFIISKETKDLMSINNFVEAVKLRVLGVKAQEIGGENITEEIVKIISDKCEDAIQALAQNFTPAFTKDEHHYFNLEIEID